MIATPLVVRYCSSMTYPARDQRIPLSKSSTSSHVRVSSGSAPALHQREIRLPSAGHSSACRWGVHDERGLRCGTRIGDAGCTRSLRAFGETLRVASTCTPAPSALRRTPFPSNAFWGRTLGGAHRARTSATVSGTCPLTICAHALQIGSPQPSWMRHPLELDELLASWLWPVWTVRSHW